MKKILVIGLSHILGGVETYIYNLVKYSDKSKYDYYFLNIGEKKSVFESEINSMFEDNKNHFYYCPNMKKNMVNGIKWITKFYKENKFDYIYMNTCTCAKFLYCIPALKQGTKLISHSHNGSGASKINNGFFRPLVKKYSVKRLSCSDVAAEWLYGTKDNCTIIPNGVDTHRFKYNDEIRNQIRKKYKIREEEIIVGHVGRFSEQKNHKYFIDLASKLPDKYKFLLIGDGELKDTFINNIKEKNIEKKFIILPSSNEIEKYYNAMDMFVMPSLYEGLPIVSVEAQTNGLPCIFSNTISKNADLSEHCKYIELENFDLWISSIKNQNIKRYDGVKEIKKRNFDIESTVKMIEKIFDK